MTFIGKIIISLYRHLQRQGYHWLEMVKEAADLQKGCVRYNGPLDVGESLFVQEIGDLDNLILIFGQQIILMQLKVR